MVKICRTGLLKLNFEIVPKKRIFRFLPKISAGHGWSWKIFFANFQTLGPLGCQGWVVIPQNVKKSQNHCTILHIVWPSRSSHNVEIARIAKEGLCIKQVTTKSSYFGGSSDHFFSRLSFFIPCERIPYRYF